VQLGKVGSNTCSEGFSQIVDKEACRAAIDSLSGKQITRSDWQGTEKDKNWPRGCYYCKGVDDCATGVWFNEHGSGGAAKGARPFCTSDSQQTSDTPTTPKSAIFGSSGGDVDDDQPPAIETIQHKGSLRDVLIGVSGGCLLLAASFFGVKRMMKPKPGSEPTHGSMDNFSPEPPVSVASVEKALSGDRRLQNRPENPTRK
jgi:hypothetical protein